MIRSGLRRVASRVKRGITKRLHNEPPVRPTSTVVSAPVGPAPDRAPEPVVPPPVVDSPVAAAVEAKDSEPNGAGEADLTREIVWELFEDMVRPALQADGGDIELVRVEDNDVYVRLMGACRSCPSSTITMKQGIERLLREEFTQFGHLIQVDAGPGHEAAVAAAAS